MRSWFKLATFRFPDIPEQEAGTLLIRTPDWFPLPSHTAVHILLSPLYLGASNATTTTQFPLKVHSAGDLEQYTLMATLLCCTTRKPGNVHHDLISHSGLTLIYWHWASQSLPYPNNGKCLARKSQVSILESLIWLNQFQTHDVPIPRYPKMGDGCSAHLAILSGPHNDCVGTHLNMITKKKTQKKTRLLEHSLRLIQLILSLRAMRLNYLKICRTTIEVTQHWASRCSWGHGGTV